MSIPIIFDPQPVLTKRHSRELAFGNEHVMREWLKTPHKPDDYKRAVLVELEQKRKPKQQLEMINKLLIALHKTERNEALRAIQKHLTKKK